MKTKGLIIFKQIICRRSVWLSLLNAFVITIVCYFFNNLPIFTGESLLKYNLTQRICEWCGIEKEYRYDDAVFIDTSAEKQLIDFYHPLDSFQTDQPIGKTTITDRKKIYQFLNYLNNRDDHKYIIVDIKFDTKHITEYDDSLYNLIRRINRIVVGNTLTDTLISPLIKEKSAFANYLATETQSAFIRYQYTLAGNRFIPMKVYEDLNPSKKVRPYGWKFLPFYISDGKLINNCCFIPFNTGTLKPYLLNSESVSTCYLYLGEDFLNNPDPDSLQTKDKYILIGDMETDVHDTYMGEKPGCLILYQAIKALESDKHVVTFNYTIIWFTIYFLISLFLFNGKSLLEYIPYLRNTKNKLLHYLFDLFSFTTTLFICSIIEYIACNTAHSLVIPILYFTIISTVFHYKKYQVAI